MYREAKTIQGNTSFPCNEMQTAWTHKDRTLTAGRRNTAAEKAAEKVSMFRLLLLSVVFLKDLQPPT